MMMKFCVFISFQDSNKLEFLHNPCNFWAAHLPTPELLLFSVNPTNPPSPEKKYKFRRMESFIYLFYQDKTINSYNSYKDKNEDIGTYVHTKNQSYVSESPI